MTEVTLLLQPVPLATSPGTLASAFLNGLYLAAILYFVGLGLSLIFGVLDLVNLAHGAFLGLGAYVSVSLTNAIGSGNSLLTTLALLFVVAPLVVLSFGLVFERVFFEMFYDIDQEYQLLGTFGLVLMAEEPISMIWGQQPLSIGAGNPYSVLGTVDLFGTAYPIYNLVGIVVFALGAIGPFVLFSRTKIGKKARAVAEDPEMANALGIDLRLMRVIVFGVSVLLAALGGALLIPTDAAIPSITAEYIILSFAVVVIGGLGSVKGAVVASLLIGFITSFGILWVPNLQAAFVFLAMAAVIAVKPTGLYGNRGILG